MKILIITLFIPLITFAKTPLEIYSNEIKFLNSISIKSCDLKKGEWLKALMLNTSFEHNFKYSKGCDLKGKITSKANTFFPVDLNIRVNKTQEKIIAKLKYQLKLSDTPIIILELKDLKHTKLKAIKEAQFKFHYALDDKKIKIFEASINGKSIPASSLN